VKYNSRARLDTSEVSDTRGGRFGGQLGGRGGVAIGGGGLGLVGVLIYVLVAVVGGGGGGSSAVSDVLGQLGQGGNAAQADNSEVAKECKTGADANEKLDCAVVADIDSIQEYWGDELPALGATYRDIPTVWFTGQVSTGCGAASSGVGPFYCPADEQVYIDLSFYDDLRTEFGAEGGLFVDAYVLAHEYGHHVQNLLGTSAKVKAGATGATSGSVRLELQADCYAGVWANHATTTPDANGDVLISDITADDISRALDAAGRIGDDYIQTHLGGGSVDTSKFTHGSSAQRRKWFTTGYHTGDPKACDTFSASDLG
jgi:predicted metalloprotease